ncbi:hypothetical protein [Amycolatopsis sp. WQ 127309]|uniref:hypothetical protein n=1 Tax=Amycolatopsis sp. WQ 127309 TaxID=2932773 RepID=UPI001FF6298A|nr:hypothetical protein [Amycolatopsis sp. WQ 127309]UOZ04707.1 hypothetical protein MUY22_38640 [Amycolatopsis sp. WQ 127309]
MPGRPTDLAFTGGPVHTAAAARGRVGGRHRWPITAVGGDPRTLIGPRTEVVDLRGRRVRRDARPGPRVRHRDRARHQRTLVDRTRGAEQLPDRRESLCGRDFRAESVDTMRDGGDAAALPGR